MAIYTLTVQSDGFREFLRQISIGKSLSNITFALLSSFASWFQGIFFVGGFSLTIQGYTRFLALTFGWSTIGYLYSWSKHSEASIFQGLGGSNTQLFADRLDTILSVAVISMLLIVVAVSKGRADKIVEHVLSVRASFPLNYRYMVAFAASVYIFVIGLIAFNRCIYELIGNPVSSCSQQAMLDDVGLYISVVCAIAAFFFVRFVGHSLVSFGYIVAASLAFFSGIPLILLLPAAIAISTLYRLEAPILISTLLTPMLAIVFEVFVRDYSQISQNHTLQLVRALYIFLPILVVVTILEAPYLNRLVGFVLLPSSVFIAAFVPYSYGASDFDVSAWRAILVFWALLPITNAFFDFVSWRACVGFFQSVAETYREIWISQKERSLGDTLFAFFRVFVSICVVLAVCTVASIGFLSVFSVSIYALNMLFVALGELPLIPLDDVLSKMALVELFGESAWISILLFSPYAPLIFYIICLCLFSLFLTFEFFVGWTFDNQSDVPNTPSISFLDEPIFIGIRLVLAISSQIALSSLTFLFCMFVFRWYTASVTWAANWLNFLLL